MKSVFFRVFAIILSSVFISGLIGCQLKSIMKEEADPEDVTEESVTSSSDTTSPVVTTQSTQPADPTARITVPTPTDEPIFSIVETAGGLEEIPIIEGDLKKMEDILTAVTYMLAYEYEGHEFDPGNRQFVSDVVSFLAWLSYHSFPEMSGGRVWIDDSNLTMVLTFEAVEEIARACFDFLAVDIEDLGSEDRLTYDPGRRVFFANMAGDTFFIFRITSSEKQSDGSLRVVQTIYGDFENESDPSSGRAVAKVVYTLVPNDFAPDEDIFGFPYQVRDADYIQGIID